MRYYFRTGLRIIADEGRENNPALVSDTSRPVRSPRLCSRKRVWHRGPGPSGQMAGPLGRAPEPATALTDEGEGRTVGTRTLCACESVEGSPGDGRSPAPATDKAEPPARSQRPDGSAIAFEGFVMPWGSASPGVERGRWLGAARGACGPESVGSAVAVLLVEPEGLSPPFSSSGGSGEWPSLRELSGQGEIGRASCREVSSPV